MMVIIEIKMNNDYYNNNNNSNKIILLLFIIVTTTITIMIILINIHNTKSFLVTIFFTIITPIVEIKNQ